MQLTGVTACKTRSAWVFIRDVSNIICRQGFGE